MFYKSTRTNDKASLNSADVIKKGLADDGGLFVPTDIPEFSSEELKNLCSKSYPERAAYVLSKYLTDYTYNELLDYSIQAYSDTSFPGGATNIHCIDSNLSTLELWHGPTCAFKDMALQLMPRLLSAALKKTGETCTAYILVATSGDTGKAALEGFKDVPDTKISVYYPEMGVSKVQKLQMATQSGSNVHVCAINGNFDDAQNAVKSIFVNDKIKAELVEKGYFFSSANSINWGRLVPQIVYYISSYCDLVNNGTIKLGDKINVCVPTGNFGNILSAYYAKLSGTPINKLICASNSNNVLTEFLSSGTYDKNRDFYITVSPSMDILISSNLERLLYLKFGADRTVQLMNSLKSTGKYSLTEQELSMIKNDFIGYYTTEDETLKTISSCYESNNYLIDTHTSVALNAAKRYINDNYDGLHMLVVSTASPYKFAKDVYRAISDNIAKSDLSALSELNDYTDVPVPYPLKDLDKRTVRFTGSIDPKDISADVIGNL